MLDSSDLQWLLLQSLLSIALFGIPVGVVFYLYHGSEHEEIADMAVIVYSVAVPKCTSVLEAE